MRQSSKRDKVYFRFMRGRRRNFFSKLGMGLINDFEGGRLRRLSSYISRKSVYVRGGGWTGPLKEVLYYLTCLTSVMVRSFLETSLCCR